MTRACWQAAQGRVEAFKGAQRPLMILGGGALARGAHGDTLALVETLGLVKDGWNGFNVLCTSRRRAWAG
jgi:TPP-dependent trihydroxycyclohexane-1,2-dione (THcHDO) dehydratase